MKPFGIDVSTYQGAINWQVIAEHDVEFVIIRDGISWGYIDKRFAENWAGAKAVNIPRACYHVQYPGQGAQRQFDNMMRALNGDTGEGAIELDCELDLAQTPKTITNEILQFGELVYRETNRPMTIYSRANWINQHTLSGS